MPIRDHQRKLEGLVDRSDELGLEQGRTGKLENSWKGGVTFGDRAS
jgi:hypothetical protein